MINEVCVETMIKMYDQLLVILNLLKQPVLYILLQHKMRENTKMFFSTIDLWSCYIDTNQSDDDQ